MDETQAASNAPPPLIKQGPRLLLGDRGRGEKLTTGKPTGTKATEKLKIAKNTLTVGTWNVQTLWASGKLELLRNEMKRFRYDIVGISEYAEQEKVKHEIEISSGQEKLKQR